MRRPIAGNSCSNSAADWFSAAASFRNFCSRGTSVLAPDIVEPGAVGCSRETLELCIESLVGRLHSAIVIQHN